VGTWIFDVQTELLTIDRNTEKILGFKPNTEAEWDACIHPDDIGKLESIYDLAINRKTQIYDSTYRIVTKSGEIKWILDRGKAVQFDEDGNPTRTAGAICDIIEQKKSEKINKENNERLELALKGADLGMWDWDLDRTIVKYILNDRAVEILGQKIKNDSEWAAIIHPNDRQRILDLDQKFISLKNHDNSFYNVEYRIITSVGEEKWISDRGRIVKWDKDGKSARGIGTIKDITQRKYAEEALRESEERFRNTFEQAAVGIAHV